MVSPLDENCDDRFTYTGDGRIIPSEDEDNWALETIKKLGLNSPRLRNWRKIIIDTLVSSEKNVDLLYLKSLMESILKGNEEWTHGFYTVLLYIAEM